MSESRRSYPVPETEALRLQELRRLEFLKDPLVLEMFEGLRHLCEIAVSLLRVRSAAITLVFERDERVLGYYEVGQSRDLPRADNTRLPRGSTLSAHVIMDDAPLLIDDVAAESRLSKHSTIHGARPQGAYAGVALDWQNGAMVGALSVCSDEPRVWSLEEAGQLQTLGRLVVEQLQLLATLRELRVREAQLRESADASLYDVASGLPNRALFDARLRDVLAMSQNGGTGGALILLGLHHLKTINQVRSRNFGDHVLREVALRLLEVVGAEHIVARLEGDEFAIVLQDADHDDIVSQHVRDITRALGEPIVYGDTCLVVTASLGVASFGSSDTDATELIRCAEIALRKAESSGRHGAEFYTPELKERIVRKATILDDVRRGIGNDEFRLHYQPICDGQGHARGFEALMRWQHPERGLLGPYEFMHAFEDPELSVALGDVALEQAITQMHDWNHEELEFGYIAVNLATSQFLKGDLVQQVEQLLRAHRVPAHRLMLEVTETVYLDQGSRVIFETLRALREIGVSFALDDFGTGYASLTHIKQFPIDRIKIDRSFVGELGQSAGDAAIVRAIVSLGRSLDIQVVAEGVETAGQLAFLQGLGCDLIQGYYFARPMPAAEAVKFCQPTRTSQIPLRRVGGSASIPPFG